MKYLLVFPAFVLGGLFGAIIFGALPTLVGILIWYGGDAYQHPDIVLAMMRPGAIIGSCIAVGFTIHFARQLSP